MARKDKAAGDYIRRLRVHHGLSPEDLSLAVRQKGTKAGYSAARVSVSGDLIRLVEKKGHIPGSRIKFALAYYFDLRPGQIWKDDEVFAFLTPEEAVAA